MNTTDDFDKLVRAVGQTVYEKRVELGMTQLDLGKLTARNQSTIAKIEKGPLPNVGVKVVYDMAQALSMSVSELFDVAEAKSMVGLKKKGTTTDSSWKKIQRALETLPPKKQKWLESIFLELVRGLHEH